MTYLGARTVHRFESGRVGSNGLLRYRVRFLLLAAVILSVGAWGMWREFFS